MDQLSFRQAMASSPCQRVAPWRRQVVFHFGGRRGAARSSISRPQSRALRARRDRFCLCVGIWESSGAPVLQASAIQCPAEHWGASRRALRSQQGRPLLEPGLRQWLPVWRHWRQVLPQFREGIVQDIYALVHDPQDTTDHWFANLGEHIKKVYNNGRGRTTLQVPALEWLARKLSWPDMAMFNELREGFPLLGQIAPGAGWRLRKDERYQNPTPLETFFKENHDFLKQKLQRAKVDEDWFTMAREIAEDVRIGRMEGHLSRRWSGPRGQLACPSFSTLRSFCRSKRAGRRLLRICGPTTSRR